VEVWLINGTLHDVHCCVEWGVLDLVDSSADLNTTDTVAPANSSVTVATLPLSPRMLSDKGRYLPFGRLLVNGQPVASNRCFLTGFRFKDLKLPPAAIEHSLRRVAGGGENEWLVQVESDAFAWAVQLRVPARVWVEDNYFDLLPGDSREIVLRGPAEDVAMLQVGTMYALQRQHRS
jgi:hypothetical protein